MSICSAYLCFCAVQNKKYMYSTYIRMFWCGLSSCCNSQNAGIYLPTYADICWLGLTYAAAWEKISGSGVLIGWVKTSIAGICFVHYILTTDVQVLDHRSPLFKNILPCLSRVLWHSHCTHTLHTRARAHTHTYTHIHHTNTHTQTQTHTHSHTHTALDHISRKGGSLPFRNGDDVKGSWRMYFECEYWCVVSIYILSHFLTPSLPLFLFLCFSFSLSLSVWMRILMQNLNFKYAFARQYMKWAHQLKKKMSSEWNMRQIWKCKVPINYKWCI